MYEIHTQYNWMFPLHVSFFHIISIYVYGLTPARNKGMHTKGIPIVVHTELRGAGLPPGYSVWAQG
jgi:hypothetical protein